MSEWSLVEVPVPANSETCSIANIPSTLKLSVTDSLPTDCVTIYGQPHHCNLNIPFQQNLDFSIIYIVLAMTHISQAARYVQNPVCCTQMHTQRI